MTRTPGDAYFIRKEEQIWLHGENILSLIQTYYKDEHNFYDDCDMDLFVYQQREINLKNVYSQP